jgi:IS30 family transposase
MAKSPANSGKSWSSGDKAELKRLAKQNTPTRVIGLKMGRSPGAVSSQAGRQGTSLKPTNQSPYGTKGKKK